jgi:hypothetical protein
MMEDVVPTVLNRNFDETSATAAQIGMNGRHPRDARADKMVTFGPSDNGFKHKGAEGFRHKQRG